MFHVLILEANQVATEIAFRQIVKFLDLARQETSSKWSAEK